MTISAPEVSFLSNTEWRCESRPVSPVCKFKSSYLSGRNLADKASRIFLCVSISLQPKSLDVCMGGCAVIPLVALDFANLDHFWEFGDDACHKLKFSIEDVDRSNLSIMIVSKSFLSCSRASRWVQKVTAIHKLQIFCDSRFPGIAVLPLS